MFWGEAEINCVDSYLGCSWIKLLMVPSNLKMYTFCDFFFFEKSLNIVKLYLYIFMKVFEDSLVSNMKLLLTLLVFCIFIVLFL